MLYSLYGLRLSADVPLEALRLDQGAQAEVRVCFNPAAFPAALLELRRTSRYVSPYQNEAGHPLLIFSALGQNEFFHFQYEDGTDFLVDAAGERIWARWLPDSTLEDTATYLFGPVLGLVLRLRGQTCLHGSVVEHRGQAVALVGPAGAGKSTAAAALAQRGLAVLSDDLVALSLSGTSFWAYPGYARVCLPRGAAEMLYGSTAELSKVTPNWDKFALNLGLGGNRFQEQPLRLRAIYMLEETARALPAVETLAARTALVKLVGNTYVNYLLDESLRAREFQALCQLVAQVPIRVVYRPLCANVDAFCRTLLGSFAVQPTSPAPPPGIPEILPSHRAQP